MAVCRKYNQGNRVIIRFSGNPLSDSGIHRIVSAFSGGYDRRCAKGNVHFLDKGNRSVTLRPEGTAGTVRAVLQNGLLNDALPLRLSYIHPAFGMKIRRPDGCGNSISLVWRYLVRSLQALMLK